LFTGSGPTRQQVHDYHIQSLPTPFVPATDPTYGPFWTVQVPDRSVQIQPFGQKVVLDLVNVPVSDSFQGFGPVNLPARATVHLEWLLGKQVRADNNPALAFAGQFVVSPAHVDFTTSGPTSATDATPFSFRTNPRGQQSVWGQVGHEVNGVFLRR
jgi:hypothetical protein